MLKQHPTSKPVRLLADAIIDVTDPDDVVLDCFGGSGSTLMAAERTGRWARLIELDPTYCDVIVRRWMIATGEEAVLESTGESFSAIAAIRQGETSEHSDGSDDEVGRNEDPSPHRGTS